MDFMTAFNNMLLGKKMIRSGWTGFYIAILQNQTYMWSIANGLSTPNINANAYTPSIADISATDWVIKYQ